MEKEYTKDIQMAKRLLAIRAQQRSVYTYQELTGDLKMKGGTHFKGSDEQFHKLLVKISRDEHSLNRGMLSSIIVNYNPSKPTIFYYKKNNPKNIIYQNDERIETDFFNLAQELGLLSQIDSGSSEKEKFLNDQITKVHDYWYTNGDQIDNLLPLPSNSLTSKFPEIIIHPSVLTTLSVATTDHLKVSFFDVNNFEMQFLKLKEEFDNDDLPSEQYILALQQLINHAIAKIRENH